MTNEIDTLPSAVIYKYPFVVDHRVEITLPEFHKILKVECQNDVACMWVLVNPKSNAVKRAFRIFGTGHIIPSELPWTNFIATFQQRSFVWHIFKE